MTIVMARPDSVSLNLDSNGASLSASAPTWACVQDNVTGLTWEVKTYDGGLQDKDHTYSWYSDNNTANGGDPGTQNGGNCSGLHVIPRAMHKQSMPAMYVQQMIGDSQLGKNYVLFLIIAVFSPQSIRLIFLIPVPFLFGRPQCLPLIFSSRGLSASSMVTT